MNNNPKKPNEIHLEFTQKQFKILFSILKDNEKEMID